MPQTQGPLVEAAATTATASSGSAARHRRVVGSGVRVGGKFRELLFQFTAGALRALGLFRAENDGFELFSAAFANVFKNRHS